MTIKSKPQLRRIGKTNKSSGGIVPIDTANIIALNDAASRRQDDLREMNNRRIDAELNNVKDLADLRDIHQKEIQGFESIRLNSIRQADQLAVSTAATQSLTAIQVLAATTQANAESMRELVNTTAIRLAAQTENKMIAITERINALEKSSYKAKGRHKFTDPAQIEFMSQVNKKMDSLMQARDSGEGIDKGVSSVGAVIGWSVSAVLGIVSVISIILAIMK